MKFKEKRIGQNRGRMLMDLLIF